MFIELGDIENIYSAFRISLIYVLYMHGMEIPEGQVLPVLEDDMLDFRLPVTSRSNERIAVEMPVSENTGIAVGISFLSCVEAEI